MTTPGLDALQEQGGGGWTTIPVGTLVVPTGATSGARIVIDGVNGNIKIYNASNALVSQIDSNGIISAEDLSNLTTANWIKLSVQDPSSTNPALLIQPGETVSPTQDWFAGEISTAELVVGANAQQAIAIYSPLTTSQGLADISVFYVACAAADGSHGSQLNAVTSQLSIQGNNGSSFPNGEGVKINTGKVAGDGGSMIVYRNSADETWHAASLQNGWTNRGGSDVPMQYRKVASPPNTVEIVGYINAGTQTDGTVLFNLPAGYRPAHNQPFVASTNTVVSGRMCLFTVNTNGDCTVSFLGASAANLGIHALVSLDA
jgi:hypothetical protein